MRVSIMPPKLHCALRKFHMIEYKITRDQITGDKSRVQTPEIRGAYHFKKNFGNFGWKVNGKVTFRKFQPKVEEYVLR